LILNKQGDTAECSGNSSREITRRSKHLLLSNISSSNCKRAGTNFGVNPNDTEQDIVKVDWQPGGCVLHKQEELILQDYYPNKGKK
jgi:hypothetical protein